MFERSHLQVITGRINEPRSFIQVISGPRQVGKTTMMAQLTKKLSFPFMLMSADDVAAVGPTWLRTIWSEARAKLKTSGSQEFLLAVDEIQKVENWSETVKREWDADTLNEVNIKVVLLGSSRLLIQKGLTESLAGRFETLHIPHWSYREMHDAFGWDVEQYIWFGGYPGAARLVTDEGRWKSYIKDSLIETSVSRDVLMLTRVDKPALLKRLFEIGCTYSSQIVSLNKLQEDLQEKGNLTTLSHYLKLLEGAGLLTGLEKYAGSVIRKRSSKPKFQVFNNALITAQLSDYFRLTRQDHKKWGRLAESAVGTHLLNASFEGKFNLNYWNESSKEVDYILERGGQLIAIEVKTGSDGFNQGLAVFDSMYHPAAMYTVGTSGIPLEEFLLSDPSELF